MASLGATLAALVAIFALVTLSEANGHASLGLDVKAAKFEDIVVDESGRLTSLDLASTPRRPNHKVYMWEKLKVPFCYGRVWVDVHPQDKTSKKWCSKSAVETSGCGYSVCTTVREPRPWYKWPKYGEEDSEEDHHHHHAHAPSPGHHGDHGDVDGDDYHKGHPHPHPHTGPHPWSPGPAEAPGPATGGRKGYGWKLPKPACSANWNVKGVDVTLQYVSHEHYRQPTSLKFHEGPRDYPCKWVPSSNGARVLVCVKCNGPTKRPPVMRTQEIMLGDQGDELAGTTTSPITHGSVTGHFTTTTTTTLPAAAQLAQVDPDLFGQVPRPGQFTTTTTLPAAARLAQVDPDLFSQESRPGQFTTTTTLPAAAKLAQVDTDLFSQASRPGQFTTTTTLPAAAKLAQVDPDLFKPVEAEPRKV